MTLLNEFTNEFAPLASNLIITQTQNIQAMPLLISQTLNNNLHSLIPNIIPTQIQFFDGFGERKAILQCFDAL